MDIHVYFPFLHGPEAYWCITSKGKRGMRIPRDSSIGRGGRTPFVAEHTQSTSRAFPHFRRVFFLNVDGEGGSGHEVWAELSDEVGVRSAAI